MRNLLLLLMVSSLAAQILTPDEVFERLYKDKVPLEEWGNETAAPDVELADLDPLCEQFLALRDAYRAAPNTDKEKVTPDIEAVMDDIISLVRSLPAAGQPAWDFFVKYHKEDMFVRPAGGRRFGAGANTRTLWRKLDALQAAYVETSLNQAHGPADLEALLEEFADRKLEDAVGEVQTVLVQLEQLKESSSAVRTRKKRFEVRQEVGEFLQLLGAESADELGSLVGWMEKKSWTSAPARERMFEVIAALGLRPRYSDPLLQRIDTIYPRERSADELAELFESYKGKLSKETLAIIKRLQTLAGKCEGAGENGLASVLHELVLLLDSDNERSQQALGRQQVGEDWLSPFAAAQAAKGLVWTERGWAPANDLVRLLVNEVYDEGAWKLLEEADPAHAVADNPWKITTGHFALQSTAGVGLSVQLLDRLEAFLLLLQRQLDGLFSWQKSAAQGWGEPLQVRLHRNAEQFAAATSAGAGPVLLGSDKVLHIQLAAGALPTHTVLHNRLCYQILAAVAGDKAEAWLAEGAALYLEAAVYWEGRMRLGSPKRNLRIASYARKVAADTAPLGFEQLVLLRDAARWQAGTVSDHEETAVSGFAFLMIMDSGRYRGDLVAALQKSAQGERVSPEDVFGLTRGSVGLLMQRYYAQLISVPGRGGRLQNP